MNRYLALTIGPIFETLATTRSTKAMWSASYLFSWLMRETLRKLRELEGITLLNLPIRDDFFDGTKRGVGLFPDRFTAKITSDFNLEKLKDLVGRVVNNLAQKITQDLNNTYIQRLNERGEKLACDPPYSIDEVNQFLHQYLRLLAIEFELPEEDKNPVKTSDAYLNSLELQASFVQELERDPLNHFFEDLYFNDFIRKEFDDEGFKSTLEIATASFINHDAKKYEVLVKDLRSLEADNDSIASQRKQEVFVKAVREIKRDRFRLCHKYIAIIRADGDHIGRLFKTILTLGAKEKRDTLATQLAGKLADFSIEAVKAIKAFGGISVYAGGDDLLFFAPVSVEIKDGNNWKRSNIFDLLHTVDGLFQYHIAGSDLVKSVVNDLGSQLPTMSYGLSVSHYKYPLAESLEAAQNLLFYDIKTKGNRNGIGWYLTKHSGVGFGMVSIKNQTSFTIFKDLLAQKKSCKEGEGAFLASVMHKLESLEGLFQATADKPELHFENIIFNNFNESIHRVEVEKDGKKIKKLSPFMQQIVDLLVACFKEGPLPVDEEERRKCVRNNLERAYSALRFVHYLETADKD